MSKRKITVFLVDDHNLVRRGFRRLLEDDPEISVVGEAGDGREAIAKVAELRPDVVVMDYALPEMNGVAATAHILKSMPETAVLMLSMHSEPSFVRACVDAGARGYLLKNAGDLDLADAVKRVAAGRQVLDPSLAALPEPPQASRNLSARELEILQLIVNGKSNKEIAALLNLSANTIAVHRANIMQALGIHNAAELVVYAIRNGLASIA
jgi:DNA-binding NarL/FixJ family response regulator